MNLKEQTLRTALMGAIALAVKDGNDEQRKQMLGELLDQYEDTGNKSFSVFDLDGDKVAGITLNESKPETVVANADAFIEWCRVNRPDLLETVEHPPVEAWTETRLRGAAVAHVQEDYALAGDVYVNADGEPVDGIEYRAAKTPDRFTLSYVAKDRGKSLVQAWRDGRLPISLGATLPQLGDR